MSQSQQLTEKQLVQRLHALQNIQVAGGLKFVEEYDDFRSTLSEKWAIEVYMKKDLAGTLQEMWQNYRKRFPDLVLVAELVEIIISSSPKAAKHLLRNTNLLYEQLIFFKENLKLVPRSLEGSEKPLFNIDLATKEVFTQAYRFEEPNDTKITVMLTISRTLLLWFRSKAIREHFVDNYVSCIDILLSFCCKHSYSVKDDTGKTSMTSANILKGIKMLVDQTELANQMMKHPNFLSWLLEGGLDAFKDSSEEMDWLFEILTGLSRCSRFPAEYKGVSLLNIIFFDLVEGYFAPDLVKANVNQHYVLQKGPNQGLKLVLACEAFRNLSKNKKTEDQFLLALRTQRTDFAPRLMAEAFFKRRFDAFLDLAAGLTTLLCSSSYTLPKYSRVLIQYCVFCQQRGEIGSSLCLLALLRMLRYHEAGTSEKIPTFEMIKMYLEGTADSSLSPLLQKELQKVDEYLEQRIRSDLEKPVNDHDLVFSTRGAAEVLKFRQGPEEVKSQGFAQLVNAYKEFDEGDPSSALKRQNQDAEQPKKEDELFGFQLAKLKKRPKVLPRYFFENNLGNIACFHIESQKKCSGCKLLRGICHTEKNEEFFLKLKEVFSSPEKPFNQFHQTGMACVQFLFEMTLEYNAKFFLEKMSDIIFPLLNDKRVEPSTRCGLLLYVSNYHDNHPDLLYVLMGSKFLMFHDNILAEFMGNFEIEMFKEVAQHKWSDRRTRKKKDLPPPASIEGAFPITKIMEQVQRPEKVEKGKEKESLYLSQLKPAPQKQESGNTITYSDVIWDSAKRCFTTTKVIVNERIEKVINEFEDDRTIDKGSKFTRYFWRLHMILHSLKLIEVLFLRFKSQFTKDSSFTGIPHQTIEIGTVFMSFLDKMLPSEPFDPNSDCWSENKMMMKDILSQMMPLFYQVVTCNMTNLNHFLRLLMKCPQYFECLTGFIGSLSGGVSIVYHLRVLNHVFFEMLISPLKGGEPELLDKYLFATASLSGRELQKMNHLERTSPVTLAQFALELMRLLRLALERNPPESLLKMTLHTLSRPFEAAMNAAKNEGRERKTTNEEKERQRNVKKEEKHTKDLVYDLNELFSVMLATFCETILKMSEKAELAQCLLESAIFDFILKQAPIMGEALDDSYKESIYLAVSKLVMVIPHNIQIGSINPFFTSTLRSLIEQDESLRILPLLRALKLMLVRERNLRPGFRSLAPRLYFLREKFKEKVIEDPSKTLNFKETNKPDMDFQNELNQIYHYSRIDQNIDQSKLENVLADLKLEDPSFNVDKDFSVNFQNKLDRADLDREIVRFMGYELNELLKILKVANERELKEARVNNPKRREKYVPGAGTIPSKLLENLHEQDIFMQNSLKRAENSPERKETNSPKTLEDLYPEWKSENNTKAPSNKRQEEKAKSENIHKVFPGLNIPDSVGIKLQIKQNFQEFNKFASALKEEALHHSFNASSTAQSSPLLSNHRINLSMVDNVNEEQKVHPKTSRFSTVFGRAGNKVVAFDSAPPPPLAVSKFKETIPKDSKPIEFSNKLMMSLVNRQNQNLELARVNDAYEKVLLKL